MDLSKMLPKFSTVIGRTSVIQCLETTMWPELCRSDAHTKDKINFI